MKRLLLGHAWMAGLLIAFATHSAQFKFSNQTLTVPDGFEVELVATTDLVPRPVSASFDEQGRLYVTDSSGSNEKPDIQLANPKHRVLRLEDTDGDGKFDKSSVFADKVMFPEGCLWYDGSVYVAAPPSIWKFTDTNNHGVADVRAEWHQGKTLTGCANDLHGPYLGPDGWIYWCKGAFAEQRYTLPNGKPFLSRAAHIFRARPDGSGIEPVLTGGMDNPVGVAFTASGERILCGTFFAPHEPGHRDGLIHAIYGGVYGKINNVTDDHKKTGDLMPVMTHMGPAAPCAVIRYESRVLGDEYRDNLFVCAFNLHKVTRHVLVPDGATFKTTDSDFLVSDSVDFHPTDVIEDADGSLIVLDTGAWYKLCCPTSQLAKPDVLGAIYRIRRKGAPRIDDPRGLKIAWGKMKPAELVKLLDDPRPAVVKRSLEEFAKQGKGAISTLADALKKSASVDARRNAVWALTRIDARAAREAVAAALDDGNDGVCLAAIHSVAVWRDSGALPQLGIRLFSDNAQLRRAAAEALGRSGGQQNAALALITAFDPVKGGTPLDRVLEHSLIYALIELGNAEMPTRVLKGSQPNTTRGALIALDQMDNGGLKPADVIPLLGSPDLAVRKTAAWVASHHPDWGSALAGFFRDGLTATNLTDADREELSQQLAQFASDGSIQQLMAERLAESGTAPATRQTLLQAMANANLKTAPAAWTPAVGACLAEKDEALVRSAVATAQALAQARTNAPNFSTVLLKIGAEAALSPDLRLEALAAVPNGLRSVEPGLLSFLCANLDPAKSVMTRNAAASVLAKARLNDDALLTLADTIKTTGPLEVTKLLAAFEHATSEAVGLNLMAALKESKGLSGVNPGSLKTLVAKYPPSVQEKGNELLTLLNVDEAKQKAHLDDLLTTLPKGDIRGGQAVFNSTKAACTACHKMGYVGGNVGPDLTSIGQVRTERDLLEAIVYPSASFVRSYEPVIVMTKSDEEFSGVLRKDAADEIMLATGPNTEVRVARSDITEMRPGRVSVMPAGLDEQLSKQELADLVAFLKGTKWGPN